MKDDKIFKRKIRSFVRREGRLTKSQARALDELWWKFGLDSSRILNIDRSKDYVLEIGFGMGDSLLLQAIQNPEVNFIGIEVHRPGVGMLLNGIAKHNLVNIKIFRDDAIVVLKNCIPDNSLDKIQIFFPDPWPKKRHHKRRIIQKEFIDLVHKKLKKGGVLHIATDWENYAEWIIEIFAKEKNWKKAPQKNNYSLRPKTKFETRGINLGHKIWDLPYIKN